MENNMQITDVQYIIDADGNNTCVQATIDGQSLSVPLNPSNRHYAEILKQVADGDLTIADAE